MDDDSPSPLRFHLPTKLGLGGAPSADAVVVAEAGIFLTTDVVRARVEEEEEEEDDDRVNKQREGAGANVAREPYMGMRANKEKKGGWSRSPGAHRAQEEWGTNLKDGRFYFVILQYL